MDLNFYEGQKVYDILIGLNFPSEIAQFFKSKIFHINLKITFLLLVFIYIAQIRTNLADFIIGNMNILKSENIFILNTFLTLLKTIQSSASVIEPLVQRIDINSSLTENSGAFSGQELIFLQNLDTEMSNSSSYKYDKIADIVEKENLDECEREIELPIILPQFSSLVEDHLRDEGKFDKTLAENNSHTKCLTSSGIFKFR